MCWFIDKNKILPLVANEDIEVIKVVLKNGKTPFLNYIVAFNERLPKVSIVPQYGSRLAMIEAGYHSYSKKIVITEQLATFAVLPLNVYYLKNCCFYKAYIPKGKKYYENEYGECVSETLVITEETIFPYNSLDISVLVDVDGQLHKKRFESNSKDKIVGVVIWENEDKLEALSLLDKDWLPLGDINNIITCEFAKKYAEQIMVSNYITGGLEPDCHYRIKELITGHVDWNMPYWDLHNGKAEIKSFYPETLTETKENAYLPYCIEISQI